MKIRQFNDIIVKIKFLSDKKTLKLLGIDVGSTTVKVAALDGEKILYKSYVRHYACVKETVLKELKAVRKKFGGDYAVSITGSAGLGLSERSGLNFVQEVQSAFIAIRKFYPDADAAVELGGEDAKIIFITGGTEQRMNGSCAGGTGAFCLLFCRSLSLWGQAGGFGGLS